MRYQLLVLGLLLASSAMAAPNSVQIRAPRLHDLYCKSCHTADQYLPPKRKLGTRESLHQRVIAYQGDVAPVSNEEINGIVEYLWRSYYTGEE